jgi:hypothetical protein
MPDLDQHTSKFCSFLVLVGRHGPLLLERCRPYSFLRLCETVCSERLSALNEGLDPVPEVSLKARNQSPRPPRFACLDSKMPLPEP